MALTISPRDQMQRYESREFKPYVVMVVADKADEPDKPTRDFVSDLKKRGFGIILADNIEAESVFGLRRTSIDAIVSYNSPISPSGQARFVRYDRISTPVLEVSGAVEETFYGDLESKVRQNRAVDLYPLSVVLGFARKIRDDQTRNPRIGITEAPDYIRRNLERLIKSRVIKPEVFDSLLGGVKLLRGVLEDIDPDHLYIDPYEVVCIKAVQDMRQIEQMKTDYPFYVAHNRRGSSKWAMPIFYATMGDSNIIATTYTVAPTLTEFFRVLIEESGRRISPQEIRAIVFNIMDANFEDTHEYHAHAASHFKASPQDVIWVNKHFIERLVDAYALRARVTLGREPGKRESARFEQGIKKLFACAGMNDVRTIYIIRDDSFSNTKINPGKEKQTIEDVISFCFGPQHRMVEKEKLKRGMLHYDDGAQPRHITDALARSFDPVIYRSREFAGLWVEQVREYFRHSRHAYLPQVRNTWFLRRRTDGISIEQLAQNFFIVVASRLARLAYDAIEKAYQNEDGAISGELYHEEALFRRNMYIERAEGFASLTSIIARTGAEYFEGRSRIASLRSRFLGEDEYDVFWDHVKEAAVAEQVAGSEAGEYRNETSSGLMLLHDLVAPLKSSHLRLGRMLNDHYNKAKHRVEF